MHPPPQLAASDPAFDGELSLRIDEVYRTNPRLPDHRSEFPCLTSYLGDPHAPVWFVAEYPSLTQVERAQPFSTPEDQWNVSIVNGDSGPRSRPLGAIREEADAYVCGNGR
jgi:hypothetical protein